MDDVDRMDILWQQANPKMSDSLTCKEVQEFLLDLVDKAVNYPKAYFNTNIRLRESRMKKLSQAIWEHN